MADLLSSKVILRLANESTFVWKEENSYYHKDDKYQTQMQNQPNNQRGIHVRHMGYLFIVWKKSKSFWTKSDLVSYYQCAMYGLST